MSAARQPSTLLACRTCPCPPPRWWLPHLAPVQVPPTCDKKPAQDPQEPHAPEDLLALRPHNGRLVRDGHRLVGQAGQGGLAGVAKRVLHRANNPECKLRCSAVQMYLPCHCSLPPSNISAQLVSELKMLPEMHGCWINERRQLLPGLPSAAAARAPLAACNPACLGQALSDGALVVGQVDHHAVHCSREERKECYDQLELAMVVGQVDHHAIHCKRLPSVEARLLVARGQCQRMEAAHWRICRMNAAANAP